MQGNSIGTFRRASPGRAAAVAAVFLAGLLCLAGCADDGTWFKPKMPQLKVVLAAGCPGSLGPAGDVANVLPSGSTLVPEGAVDGALICLYGKEAASEVGPAPLKKQVRLSAPDATRLKTAVAGVALKGPEGPVACPAALPGAAAIIDFHFGQGGDFDLWYETTGCQTLDDGTRGAFQPGNPSFYTGFSPLFWRLAGTP